MTEQCFSDTHKVEKLFTPYSVVHLFNEETMVEREMF